MTDPMSIDGEEPATTSAVPTPPEPKKKTGGWPKGKPRSAPRSAAPTTAEPTRPGVRVRKRKGGQLVDKYDLSPEMKADFAVRGMTPEWKREMVYGAIDPSYMAFMRDQGFEPVDASRFPDFVASGVTGPIRRDGMILMERPIELTREAMMEDRIAARDAVAIKEAQLHGNADGEFQRTRPDGSPISTINRSLEYGGAYGATQGRPERGAGPLVE